MSYSLQKKAKKISRSDLEQLDKEELIDRIIQIEAHNTQLLNIINKNEERTSSKVKKEFDFTKAHFRHILLKFYYLGWNYQGFACQEDTINTIEYHLFNALKKTCLIQERSLSNYHRCGRTDKGVSSFCQVISIDVRSKFLKDDQNKPENISNEISYCKILNRVLPKEIQCISWCPVDSKFSARFNCEHREYKYFFPKANLNLKSMQEAGNLLLGTHDFRNLCKMDVANGVVSYIRDIRSVNIEKVVGQENVVDSYNMYTVTIVAKAFLWHQIRCMMAVLFLVGEGKEQPDIITKLLDIETVKRKPQYNMAAELPLNLFHCHYEGCENWIIDKEAIQLVMMNLQENWIENSVKTSMIYSMLNELGKYTNLSLKLVDNILVPGVTAKKYQPLLLRQTCESLEDRIIHFKKKRKIGELVNDEDK